MGSVIRYTPERHQVGAKGFYDYRPLSKMECPQCDRLIIPRVVSYQGCVIRTVCPFCAETIWKLKPSWLGTWFMRIFSGLFLLMFLILALMTHW